jgi:hypothetical protein
MAQDPSQAITAPGKAPIVRQGQTSNGQFGSDPNAQPKGRGSARDLNVK